MKRTGRADRHDRVELPPVAEPRMAFRKIRQLVTQCCDESMTNVEIRIRTLAFGVVAVVGLRRISHVILPVRSVIDRMRPDVIYLARKPMESPKVQTGLHRVVIGFGRRLELVDVKERSARRSERPVIERTCRRNRRIDRLIYIAIAE